MGDVIYVVRDWGSGVSGASGFGGEMSDGYKTILERLEMERVFKITRDGDYFVIEECCDNCFDQELTRAELHQLAQEILDLAR